MKIEAESIEDYKNQVPEERKAAFYRLYQTIQENIPVGFEEAMSYGMIGWVVPKSTYPPGYHCDPQLPLPFVSLANQKNFLALYHMGIYAQKELYDWFVAEYPKHAKYKLDMGKSCIRFKRMDDIPFDLIGELMQKISVEDWINIYESAFRKWLVVIFIIFV